MCPLLLREKGFFANVDPSNDKRGEMNFLATDALILLAAGRFLAVVVCSRKPAGRSHLLHQNLAYFRSWGYFFNTDAE